MITLVGAGGTQEACHFRLQRAISQKTPVNFDILLAKIGAK